MCREGGGNVSPGVISQMNPLVIHGVHERDKGGDPGHRGHALQDLRSPRLVVRITEINAYNEEVWVDLEEQTEPMVQYGDAAADAHRDLARSKV